MSKLALAKKLGSFLLIGAGVCVATIAGIAAIQHKLIYMPRTYSMHASHYELQKRALGTVTKIRYSTAEGDQVAWYSPPGKNASPKRLWLAFGGNAALALDFTETFTTLRKKSGQNDLGVLLVDYPGYGENAGSPSPAAILEASLAAVDALQKHLGLSRAEMAEQLPVGVLGHSLGSAAALQFVRHAAYSGGSGSEPPLNIDRIVLVSPFTSLLEMSKRVVGPIPGLRHLLRHPFDNRAELQAIIRARKAAGSADGSAGAAGESKGEAKQSSSGSSGRAPKFTIIHGSRDEIVPVEQGRELGKLSSAALPIEYVEIRGGDHNGILYSSRDIVFKAMM